jgi:hypothetical protein
VCSASMGGVGLFSPYAIPYQPTPPSRNKRRVPYKEKFCNLEIV